MEQQPQQHHGAAPATTATTTTPAREGGRVSRIISLVARPVQAVLGIIVLGMAAWFIHGAYTDEMGLALVCGLFSILLFGFATLTLLLAQLKGKPIIAVILAAADALLAILWLASMGSNAHLHSKLNVRVTCRGTVDNGGLVNSKTCLLKRTNPYLVVGPAGRAIIIAVALLSALEFLLFLGTTFLSVRAFLAARKSTASTHPKGAEAGLPMQEQHTNTHAHPHGGAASVGAGIAHPQQQGYPQQQHPQQPYDQQQQPGYAPPPSVSPVSNAGGYAQPQHPQQGYPQQGYPQQPHGQPQQHGYPSPTTSPVQQGTVNGQQVYYPPPHQ